MNQKTFGQRRDFHITFMSFKRPPSFSFDVFLFQIVQILKYFNLVSWDMQLVIINCQESQESHEDG